MTFHDFWAWQGWDTFGTLLAGWLAGPMLVQCWFNVGLMLDLVPMLV